MWIIDSYALGYSKAYQVRTRPQSVVVLKVKGVTRTSFTNTELAVPNPEFYRYRIRIQPSPAQFLILIFYDFRRVWDANDVVFRSYGGESGGFFITTNVIITPNQTRGVCAEVRSGLRLRMVTKY